MIILLHLPKVLLCLISLTMISGCHRSKAPTVQIPDTSQSQDTAEIEYYNSLKAPAWTVEMGVGMDAFKLTSDAEHTLESTILNNSSTATISFWLKPETNIPGLPLLSVVNEAGEILKLTNLTQRDDGTLQGMALQMKAEGQEQWLLSNSEFTLNTHRYNHLMLVLSGTQAAVYLNGRLAMNGDLGATVNQIEKSWLVVGKDGIAYGACMEGQFQDFRIRRQALSAEEAAAEFELFYPEVLLSEITIPNSDDLQDTLTLYPQLDNQYDAVWTSSKPEFLKIENNQGKITVPTAEQGDQQIILTLSAQVNGRRYQREFPVTVKALTPKTLIMRDRQALITNTGYLMNAETPLPAAGENGSIIEWTVTEGEVRIENNQLIKNNPGTERVPARLRAQLSLNGETTSESISVTVLDPYAGYVLSYFNGDLGKEGGKLALSTDGLHWTDLNDGKTLIKASEGTGRVRDPFIGRAKDGSFIILATEGYDNPSIYIWKSQDLTDFGTAVRKQIAWFDRGLYSTGQRAWAPEMTYDSETDQFFIYYSDAGDAKSGSIFAVRTTDFETFTYPESLFNPGYKVIDGTILRMHGRLWMLYKDEREAAQTIFYAAADHLSDGFLKRFDELFIYNRKYIEGPFVLPVLNEPGSYYLYVDNYPNQRFYVAKFSQLGDEADFRWLNEDEYALPNEDVRHGSAIAVTQKELDRLRTAYQ